MADKQVGLNIDVSDLQTLAGVNPLAWEQLLHIADVRVLKQRIIELEAENTRLSVQQTGYEKNGVGNDTPHLPSVDSGILP